MLIPNKITQPQDSLIYVASVILNIRMAKINNLDELYEAINSNNRIFISYDKFILAMDFLYSIGIMDMRNAT
jgi:hypothetical protein